MRLPYCPIHPGKLCEHNIRVRAGFQPFTSPKLGHAYIYRITHVETGLVYVGYTIRSLAERWEGHRSDAKRRPEPLYVAMRESGIHMFVMEELEQCAESIKHERELDYMRIFESWNPAKGYNPPDREAAYLMKLYFLFNPDEGAAYMHLWEKRRSIVAGWYELNPLPPESQWLDIERHQLEAKAMLGGKQLAGSISSLASPVVTAACLTV
jgi:predicted GIY-YIG superfamily endonuclease